MTEQPPEDLNEPEEPEYERPETTGPSDPDATSQDPEVEG